MAPRHLPSVWALILLTGGAPAVAQDGGGTWALTNARIETVTRGTIPRGTVIIRDGRIAAVGADVAIPADARVVDLAGRTVSPGLIDLTATTGLPAAVPASQGAQVAAVRRDGLDAERLVADELRAGASDLRAAREAGVTALLVAPERGLFRGRSALVAARDSLTREAVIRSPVALHIGYQGVGGGTYPGSLLGVIAYQRQALYDASRYGLLQDRWRSDPRSVQRPVRDPSLEALVPVVRGEIPAFVDARNENEIRRAARLGREHGLKLVVVGATEGWRALDALRGHGVVVSVNFPRPSEVTGWRYRGSLLRTPGDSSALEAAARRVIERNPAALHQAGIVFALASGGTRPADFVSNLRKAVAAGLPAEAALQGATIRAAELAGIGAALGSIESGKIANIVVSNGPLLADSARVSMVFVDGIRYEGASPPARTSSGGGAAEAGTAAVQFGGTWNITTTSPQGANTGALTVTQQGTAFSGTMTSDLAGSAAVSDGKIEGRRVTWSVTLSFGGQSFTLNYAGEVDGNRLSGTVTAGEFGSFTFTGERRP
ncbi:MAG TPA: amidohydrolase family protein [Gemmatimonadales bacterium]